MRHGFTLLEVLLAIAISVLVMAIVGSAMFFQLQVVDSSRGEVEQAQLARALMQQIADDLRNVVRYEPQDVSSLMQGSAQDLAAAAAGTDPSGGAGAGTGGTGSTGGAGNGGGAGSGGKTSGGGTGGGSKTAGGGGSGSASQGSSGSSSGATDGGGAAASSDSGSANTPTVEETPGLRGGPYELQVDISRLPRRDQLLSPDGGGIVGKISDVKTVSYFVDDATTAADGQVGLKRFETSRAESLLSLETGTMETQQREQSKLLAAEVVAIRFQYSDGAQWFDVWPPEASTGDEAADQKAAAKLPVAVHVVVTFRPQNADPSSDPASWSSFELRGLPQRRLIVHLPAALPPGEEPAPADESAKQDSSTASNTSGSQGQGQGQGQKQGGSKQQGTGAKQ